MSVGDRVAAIMPNMPESIVGVLAAASIGAVWSSCSPDFGVQGVLDRFGQIEPKVLIACDGYYYGGKTIDIADKLAEIVAKLPIAARGHRRALSRPRHGRGAGPQRQPDPQGRPRADLGRCRAGARRRPRSRFERLPFAHPLYVLFSSGTTGMPKCIVHSAGGALLKHMCEHRLHADIKRGRPRLLFHDAGLDDVELAGLGPRLRRHPAALRRLAVPSRRQHPVGLRAGGEGHAVRHVGEIHRRHQEGRAAPGQDARRLAASAPCCRPARRWRPTASTTSTRP